MGGKNPPMPPDVRTRGLFYDFTGKFLIFSSNIQKACIMRLLRCGNLERLRRFSVPEDNAIDSFAASQQ